MLTVIKMGKNTKNPEPVKAEAPKAEPAKTAPKKAVKAEAVKAEVKAEAPAKKTRATKKAEAPKAEVKADAPKTRKPRATKAEKAEGKPKRQRRQRRPASPNRPKRPLTAYFMWLEKERAGFRAKFMVGREKFHVGEFSKFVKKHWDALDSKTKKSYEDKYNANKAVFNEALKKYKESKATAPSSVEAEAPKAPVKGRAKKVVAEAPKAEVPKAEVPKKATKTSKK